jgi:hypothetical protein
LSASASAALASHQRLCIETTPRPWTTTQALPIRETRKGRFAAGLGPGGITSVFFPRFEAAIGKRSSFTRIARDLYDTPVEAVRPLLGWLQRGTPFIEPCYGDGALARVLKGAGHRLMQCHDLPTDARVHFYSADPGVIFITNPPYWGKPQDLHPLIENLSDQAPTWLLMSSDWLFNQSSSELVARRLRRIVAVGRVKWIPNSPHVGKDNCAWLLFYRHGRRATFIGRAPPRPRAARSRSSRLSLPSSS